MTITINHAILEPTAGARSAWSILKGTPINNRTQRFIDSSVGIELRTELVKMTKSQKYNTRAGYQPSVGTESFADKHMKYMSQYPDLNYEQYISNLKLMTKIAPRS